MDKTTAINAHISAELEISLPETETIIKALENYWQPNLFITNEERRNAYYLHEKFLILHDKIKGGNNAKPMV